MADKGFNESRRVTLEEIAEATGVHRTTLSKIANHRGYNTTTEVLDKLCTFFRVPLSDFAEHVSDSENDPV